MKKYGVLLAFVILAFSVPLAQSSTTGSTTRLRKLERKVAVLVAQVKTAQLRLACITDAAPLTDYGVPASNEGYIYQRPTATPSTFPTTALDLTLKGDKPTVYAVIVKGKCVKPVAATAAVGTRRGAQRAATVRWHAAR